MKSPIRVAVTGAAGQIGYSVLFRIASGAMFGPDQPVILQLIEAPIEKAMKALEGVAMELDDCAFPLLKGVLQTSDPAVGFKDANWCLLVGAKPRGPGMERADLLKDNGRIFIGQGQVIDAVAAEDARVAVVGNPANTNCMIAASQAKRLPPDRFTAMVRLDQNRAQVQLAKKAGVDLTAVQNIFIYGNHSPTMFPAFAHATINGQPGEELRDLRRPHLCRVPLAMEDDVPTNPGGVRLFGPPTVVPRSNRVPHAIEELRGRPRVGESNDDRRVEGIGHRRRLESE